MEGYHIAGWKGAIVGIFGSILLWSLALWMGFILLLIPVIGIFVMILFWIICFFIGLAIPVKGFHTVVGPCPYCGKWIGVVQSLFSGDAFDCNICKQRVFFNKDNKTLEKIQIS